MDKISKHLQEKKIWWQFSNTCLLSVLRPYYMNTGSAIVWDLHIIYKITTFIKSSHSSLAVLVDKLNCFFRKWKHFSCFTMLPNRDISQAAWVACKQRLARILSVKPSVESQTAETSSHDATREDLLFFCSAGQTQHDAAILRPGRWWRETGPNPSILPPPVLPNQTLGTSSVPTFSYYKEIRDADYGAVTLPCT